MGWSQSDSGIWMLFPLQGTNSKGAKPTSLGGSWLQGICKGSSSTQDLSELEKWGHVTTGI